MFDKSPPLVVGHRGASVAHPENTLEAFEGAIEAGADAVELDVRLTADGVPVVLHDLDLSRTTDGTGMVHELSLSEVKRLDASAGKGPRTEIPTLREALQVLAGRAVVNLELKNLPGEPSFDSPREAVAEAAVNLVQEFGIASTSLLSSFNWLSIERVQALAPDVATGFLTIAPIDPWAALVYATSQGHRFVLPQAAALFDAGESFVREAHERGIGVGTWTLDDPEDLQKAFILGVDAVATNVPEIAVPIRDRFRAGRTAARG